jgi:hypothetical protein
MAIKNIYEVLDDFRNVKTKQDRIDVLRKNDSYALRNVLLGTFNPDIQYTVTEIPAFKREQMPAGMSYGHMTEALSRVYLFVKGNPRVSPDLTDKRKTEILIQILESLEEKEADVFAGMLKKDLNVPYLTPLLVNEAFPGLLPQS